MHNLIKIRKDIRERAERQPEALQGWDIGQLVMVHCLPNHPYTASLEDYSEFRIWLSIYLFSAFTMSGSGVALVVTEVFLLPS